MKLLLAVLKLLITLVLVPLSLDWRSPLLACVRQWALIGLIAVPVVLIFAEVLALRTAKPGERVLKVLNTLGLLLAVTALTATVAIEARFQWARHHVLHADPARLEKLGRHIVVGYQDLSEVKELVRLRAITGVFVSSRNVLDKTVVEVRQEIQSLQDQRQKQGLPPLWIATDQEGGVVSRVSPPLARMPPISEVMETYPDPAQREKRVRQYALRQGRELSALGINLNFAPVVDVNYQIRNPNDRFTRIHLRAISSDPAVVAQVAGWYCCALEQAGVQSTLKHFPGLGRVFEDTHAGNATLATPLEELFNSDWVPFRTLMGQGNVFTMLSHVRLAAIDADRPVSTSPLVVSGLLRGKWKYEGVLITDDFSMSAVYRSGVGIENGSIDALNAGVDLILISWDADQYYRVMHALLKAGRDGKLSPEALIRSDRRIERARQALSQKR